MGCSPASRKTAARLPPRNDRRKMADNSMPGFRDLKGEDQWSVS
jgi:hypothetical protein